MQEEKNKIKLPVVVGPTASGKTDLAIEIALKCKGEIVSADSIQVYKGIEIASATPSLEERRGVKHHMMEVLPLKESFSVVKYTDRAKKIIFNIKARGKTPVLVGGTGLYIDSLMQNIDFGQDEKDEKSEEIENRLRLRLETEGAEALYKELEKVDIETAKKIHPNNHGRLLRALTVYYTSGITMSERQAKSRQKPSPFLPTYIGISYRDRELLYERINLRVEQMLENGLLEEVKNLISLHGKTSFQAIGHKEILPYIEGDVSLEEAKEKLKRETRRYAKRQLTWFRKNEDILWFYKDDYKNIGEFYEDVFSALRREGFDIEQ